MTLEWRLDAILHVPKTTLGPAALWYASIGLPVFPCWPNAKEPMTPHGVKDATTDVERIRRFWKRKPDANIGAAMGVLVDLVDIDGVPGHRSLNSDPELMDGMEVVARVHTPRPGGVHFFIPATGEGNSSSGGMAPGVDFKGRGGYALMPPSHTVMPEYRGHYRFITQPKFPRPTN